MSITSFAATEFLHDDADADWKGFAPTQVLSLDRRAIGGLPAAAPVRPRLAADAASLATARWVEEQEAAALAAIERARIARAATAANAANAALAAARGSAPSLRRGWLARLESTLDRLLPGALGSLLQLFVCVSLTMAMISALLPMVDRI